MDVSRRIGEWKKAHGVEALQPQRYQEIINTRSQWAQQHGLTGDFAKQIFDIIHQESLKKQL
jgi:chorismate mutase